MFFVWAIGLAAIIIHGWVGAAFAVGMIISSVIIISGCVSAALVKRNQKKSKWPTWVIIFGVIGFISAFVNYNIFSWLDGWGILR
jgi:di/tricarboxylate transporter